MESKPISREQAKQLLGRSLVERARTEQERRGSEQPSRPLILPAPSKK